MRTATILFDDENEMLFQIYLSPNIAREREREREKKRERRKNMSNSYNWITNVYANAEFKIKR